MGELKTINPKSVDKTSAGNVCPVTTLEIKPRQPWETMAVIIDSCAIELVFHHRTAAAYELKENEASKLGREYEIANGDTIHCRGEKQIADLTLESTLRRCNSNCADVAFGKSLQSVRALKNRAMRYALT